MNTKGFKNSKMIVKSFLSNLITPKEKIKKEEREYYVCDALPDNIGEKQSAAETDESNNVPDEEDTFYKSEPTFSETDDVLKDDSDNIFNEEDTSKEKEEKSSRKGEGSKGGRKPSSKPVIKNVTVNNGYVHIGDNTTYSQTWNIQQIYNKDKGRKEKKKSDVMLTPQIEALFKWEDKLELNHIQFLSKHFGSSWRSIGLKLGISSRELDMLKSCYKKDYKEMAFHLLCTWSTKKGDDATIGRLCMELWISEITMAREAVKQMSENMSNFTK